MSTPGREDPRGEQVLTPARRNRTGRTPSPETAADYDDADVQRGLAAAVLGALGRLQLRLEALSRQQSAAFAEVQSALAGVENRLAALDSSRPQAEVITHADAPPWPESGGTETSNVVRPPAPGPSWKS